MQRFRLLRIVALAEAATLLALVGVAVPLKHIGGYPAAVSILGPVHGLVFLAFAWLVIREWSSGLIVRSGAFRLLVGAVIPFGGIWNERWLARLDRPA